MRPDSSKTSALYKSRTYLLTYLLTSYSLTYKTLTNLNSLISITRSLLNPIAAYIPEMPPLLSPLLAQSLKNTNHSFYHASPYSRTTFLFLDHCGSFIQISRLHFHFISHMLVYHIHLSLSRLGNDLLHVDWDTNHLKGRGVNWLHFAIKV